MMTNRLPAAAGTCYFLCRETERGGLLCTPASLTQTAVPTTTASLPDCLSDNQPHWQQTYVGVKVRGTKKVDEIDLHKQSAIQAEPSYGRSQDKTPINKQNIAHFEGFMKIDCWWVEETRKDDFLWKWSHTEKNMFDRWIVKISAYQGEIEGELERKWELEVDRDENKLAVYTSYPAGINLCFFRWVWLAVLNEDKDVEFYFNQSITIVNTNVWDLTARKEAGAPENIVGDDNVDALAEMYLVIFGQKSNLDYVNQKWLKTDPHFIRTFFLTSIKFPVALFQKF